MSQLTVRIDEDRTRFFPCEEISGTVQWSLETPPESLELRLFWYTEGKGDQDLEVVKTRRWDTTQLQGEETFRFRLPKEPYSFSGKLISLLWALELMALPGGDAGRIGFALAPTGEEIRLGAHTAPGEADAP